MSCRNYIITALLSISCFILYLSNLPLPAMAQENKSQPGAEIIIRGMPSNSSSTSTTQTNSSGGPSTGSPADKIKEDFVVGKVKTVSEPVVNSKLLDSTGMVTRIQQVEIEIQEGPLKGKTIKIENALSDNPAFNISVLPGKEVILSVVSDNGKAPELNIADYHRAPILGVLGAVFLALFLFFGGKNGLKSLLGLAFAIAMIGMVLLPLSLKGFDPLISSVFICFAAACATICSIGGFSRKSLAAFLGTIGGVIIAGVAAHYVINMAPLTGLSSEEAQILRATMPAQAPTFFSGLLAASMLIGALGVIMDVSISIASAVHELSQTDLSLTAKQLYEKGMNVGRDIMGSMTSTLVLAYAGGALPLLLLMSSMPSSKLVNLDLVASEIASALTGSLGLVLTIPLTALASSKLMGQKDLASSPAENPDTKNENNTEELIPKTLNR